MSFYTPPAPSIFNSINKFGYVTGLKGSLLKYGLTGLAGFAGGLIGGQWLMPAKSSTDITNEKGGIIYLKEESSDKGNDLLGNIMPLMLMLPMMMMSFNMMRSSPTSGD